jgi:hypothetical protein
LENNKKKINLKNFYKKENCIQGYRFVESSRDVTIIGRLKIDGNYEIYIIGNGYKIKINKFYYD